MTNTQRLLAEHPDGADCHYCSTPLDHPTWPGTGTLLDDGTWTGNLAVPDHATPRVRGGTRIVPACAACNARKGTRAYLDYLLDPAGESVPRSGDVPAPRWMR